CRGFDEEILPYWRGFSKEWLEKKIVFIKEECKNKPFDCILGLSGGVDSSYLLHYMKTRYDLRILAVHTDAGWNTQIANENIKKLVNKLQIPLHTITINWEEMRDLQVAFLKSGVANCDVPQDMAFFAALYGYAVQNGIRYVLTGSNFATESIYPSSWEHDAMDSIQLRDIHKKFGKEPLVTFPVVSFFDYHILYPKIYKMEILRPLNNIEYGKKIAIDTLTREYGWENYGNKHCESIWTKFFQEYFLPTKFGYDKRRPHYSSMILAGEMSREEALKKLESPAYQGNLEEDLKVILGKLGLSKAEWEEIMQVPIKSYKDYRNNLELLTKKQTFDIFFE
ncbi:MAG: N-acetyl sugar amidotransferase, partial [Helicobacter sp.]|nr:N-acetyl sugar amidotransferase [Helicobacter sp.]